MHGLSYFRLSMGFQRWVILAVVLLLIAPLCVTEVPMLLDYPNHLARAYLLAFGPHDPFLSHFYAPHWNIIPNLALDVLLQPLLHILPVYLAGKITIALAILTPVIGASAYHKAAFRRVSLWPWAASLIAFNGMLLLGMLNFLISLGAALLGSALWLRYRERHPAWLATIAACTMLTLFFMHVFGVPYFLLIVTVDELGFAYASRKRADHSLQLRIVIRNLVSIFSATIPSIILYFFSPTHLIPHRSYYVAAIVQLWELGFPSMGYWRYDKVFMFVFLAGFFWFHRTKIVHVRPATCFTCLILLVAAIFMPFSIKETTLINGRLMIMAAFLLFSGSDITDQPVQKAKRYQTIFACLLIGLLAVRVGSLSAVWQRNNKDIVEFQNAISTIRPGSKVLTVSVKYKDNQKYWDAMPRRHMLDEMFCLDSHLPAMLVIERHSFWPFLFAAPGKQPIDVLPPYNRLAITEDQPPSYHTLNESLITQPRILHDWQQNFDYVLVLDAGGVTDWPWTKQQLIPIATSKLANIYKIVRQPAEK